MATSRRGTQRSSNPSSQTPKPGTSLPNESKENPTPETDPSLDHESKDNPTTEQKPDQDQDQTEPANDQDNPVTDQNDDSTSTDFDPSSTGNGHPMDVNGGAGTPDTNPFLLNGQPEGTLDGPGTAGGTTDTKNGQNDAQNGDQDQEPDYYYNDRGQRVLKQGAPVSFDGHISNNILYVDEDVLREIQLVNSRTPQYVQVFAKGKQLTPSAAEQYGFTASDFEQK